MVEQFSVSKDLLAKAQQILTENSRADSYTVPSGRLYPYQWNWDSGFIALGWACFDYQRALREVESLFIGQWKNGMVPHIVFHEFEEHYAPGPLDWQVPDHVKDQQVCTSGITQPPIIGSVLYRIYTHKNRKTQAQNDDVQFMALYKKTKAYHDWFMSKRTIGPDHDLCLSLHPWESGMDNSPSWDDLLKNVPDEDMSGFRRKDVNDDNLAERPHDHDYRAYMSLVYHYRRVGYDQPDLMPQAHFRVYDLVLNSLLLRSARDMKKLSALLSSDLCAEDEAYWDAQIDKISSGLQKLWSESDGAFLNGDAKTKALLEPVTNASFLPLYAGAASKEQAQALAQKYKEWREVCGFSVATIDPLSDKFEATRYWRGPIWMNTNWLIAEGFKDYGYDDIAAEIRADSAELIERFGYCEYFTPDGVRGCGADQFSWSAALALYWLAE